MSGRFKKTWLGPVAVLVLLVGLLATALLGPGSANVESSFPSSTEKLTLAGCSNLHKVTEGLYRGAQPDAEGFAQLQKQGIKTVVNLRQYHSDRDELEDTSLDYIHIKMQAWDPEFDEIKQFLQIAVDSGKQPVFVHCQHGADRTGTMVAAYRVVVQGWSKQKALDEMTKGGFNYHKVWTMLPEFIDELDVEKMRSELQLPKPEGKLD